ncbi:MAG: HlyD family secretion protein [Anaerolineae bacterium]
MNRRWILLIGALIVIIALFLVLGGQFFSGARLKPTPTPASLTVLEEPPVTAEGLVVPLKQAHLSFSTSGTLQKLFVEEGQTIEAGQTLAQLDTAQLELAVRAAQDSVAIQEALLAQALASPRWEEIQVAQANYEAAQAQYEQAAAGPQAEEVEMARTDLEKAAVALQQAQAEYDKIAWLPGVGARPEAVALEQATLDYQRAQAAYRLTTTGPTETDLQVAQSNVASAKAQLDLAKAGPREVDIAVVQAQLEQAKTALAQAQLNLEMAQMKAPFSGTITAINAREGEVVTAAVPVITLADLSELRVETTDLDEWGAAKVQVGQKVEITVNAFDNKVLIGQVIAIAKEATVLATGDTTYVVTITLDEQDPDLRWGMTTKVSFD